MESVRMCMFFHIVSNNNSFKLRVSKIKNSLALNFIRALLRTLYYTRLNQLQDRYIYL